MAKAVKATYVEPMSYFSEEARRALKIGEFSDEAIKKRQEEEANKATSKKVKRTTRKK